MSIRIFKLKVKSLLIRFIRSILRDSAIQQRIWEIVHEPLDIQTIKPENIQIECYRKAVKETAEYVAQNMGNVQSYSNRNDLLKLSLSKVQINGLFLELGVGKGESINFIADRIESTVHGFDSFEGLPEPWFDGVGKGAFSTNGKLPIVHSNVKLHVGWFEESLPKFVTENQKQIAYMHIDCDLYSATKTAFDMLGDAIVSGTVIQFDEYFNYPGWKEHEFKAFQQFIKKTNLTYEYLGYNRCGFSVAVIIK